MGRHSRGSGEPPAPLPDPPARHPYAPRSAEDTGDSDRRTYRVVDVGPPAGTAEPPRYGARSSAPRDSPRPSEPRGLPAPDAVAAVGSGFRAPDGFGADRREPRFGATRSDLVDSRPVAPTGESRRPAPTSESRRAAPTSESRFGGRRGDGGESRFPASTAGPAGLPFGGGEPRFGATRADLVEPRPGGSLVDSGESRLRAPVAEPGEPRFGESRFGGSGFGGSRFGPDESRLPPPPAPGPAPVRPEPRFGATRADLLDPQLTRRDGPVEPRIDLAEPHPARRADAAEPRFGATRLDLAESVGSTALAPRPAADPDEVTDTGARRARSAFRLATEDDEAGEAEHDELEDEHDDHEHEPALLLQWAIFVAQTLTGAVAGIGVWLGFYRLWSTWPFYAVPAVGVAAIATLVLARTLRRRHGRDLDLLTAVVTAVVITVLTVLPAAFTLQGLTQ